MDYRRFKKPYSATSVSYTHLDVYKRQGYSIGTLIISTNNEWLKNIPFSISYIPWIIFLILGFVIAFVFAKNYEIILAVLSVLFGAFILSFYIIYLLEKYAGIIIGNCLLYTS